MEFTTTLYENLPFNQSCFGFIYCSSLLGEREIDSSFHSAKLQETYGQYSLIDTLHYAFYPNENMQDIICQIAGNWVYKQTDERRNCAVSKQLRVTSTL